MDTHYSGNGYTEYGRTDSGFSRHRSAQCVDPGPGKITLDGFDAARRLGLIFDDVILNPVASIPIDGIARGLARWGPGRSTLFLPAKT